MSARASLSPREVDPALQETMVKTIKGLSMDAVQQANSGHPGMPMGCAHMATVLWTQFLVHDPKQPDWFDRDRFVLSAGHGSMLAYALLHLTGYDVSLDDIKQFRQWGSKTPGHPEYGDTPGVEVTTGPLGTGFAAGVGMALAERFLAAKYNRSGHEIVDHFTYGIVSDGDLMEGVAAESASLAGHLKLGKLVYLYDDNQISIDGGTEISFTEDVAARFESYGWHVQKVDGHDTEAIAGAITAARKEGERPSIICCRTVIGHGAPTKGGTSGAHGAPLGAEEIAATKTAMDWPAEPFHVPSGVTESLDAMQAGHTAARTSWEGAMKAYAEAHADTAAELERAIAGELPDDLFTGLPEFPVGEKIASRKASHKVLTALVAKHPTLMGGSADLAGSNGVALKEEAKQQASTPTGREIHFGVREHGMGGICNGLALHGGVRPYDATFLIFSDFMRGAVRLSALMHLPVVHIFTHDSFFLGEDGPTHQPIEHAMALRAMPNLHVVRPADAKETIGAWKLAMERKDGPTALLLTRQGLPTLENSRDDITRGAYVVHDPGSEPDGALIATGSEVSLALEAAKALEGRGKSVRVVSIPCWEAFEAQDETYRNDVLPPSLTRRLSIEAGTTFGWDRYARNHHGIDRFGASAPAGVLAEKFGFTVDAVVDAYLALD